MDRAQVKQHVAILGWFYVVCSLVFIVAGILLFMFFAGIGLAAQDAEALPILGVIGTVAGALCIVPSVPGLIAGFGLLTGKSWGRILGIVVGVLFLFNVPIGTALGVYTLWVLTSDAATQYFQSPASPPTPAV